MTVTEEARAAIDAVKAKHPSWRAVAEHASALPSKAGALKRVLERAAVSQSLGGHALTENVRLYGEASAAAVTAQARHKRYARRAAWYGFLAAVVAGLMLYLRETPISSSLGAVLGGLHLFFLGLAFWAGLVISTRKPFRTWAQARGQSETRRIAHFEAIMLAKERAGQGELALAPLQLEYMRAFLIDDQRTWFTNRSPDFAREVQRNRLWRVAALAFIVFAALPAVATLIEQPIVSAWTAALLPYARWITRTFDQNVFALLGVVGGALQTLITLLAATSLAARNAESYGFMAERLGALSGDPLTAARAAAASGDPNALIGYWIDVSFELKGEMREWSGSLATAQTLVRDDFPGIRIDRAE